MSTAVQSAKKPRSKLIEWGIRQMRREIELNWHGAIWIAAFLIVGFSFLQGYPEIPPIGISIGLLGAAAIVVGVRTEHLLRVEKSGWVVVAFLLFAVEMRTIYHDRDQHDAEVKAEHDEQAKHFAEIAGGIESAISQSSVQFAKTMRIEQGNLAQTLGGLKETVNAATGGNGFCYAILVPPDVAGTATAISSIIPQGKYPLTNVNALVTDDDMMVEYLNESTKTGRPHSAEEFSSVAQRAQEWIHIGDLPPRFPEQFSMRATAVTGDRRMLTIMFWANNGSWTEKFALRRVNGKWLRLIRVWRQRLDKKKNAMVADVVFNQVDQGFPEDTNTKASSGLSVSPSQ